MYKDQIDRFYGSFKILQGLNALPSCFSLYSVSIPVILQCGFVLCSRKLGQLRVN